MSAGIFNIELMADIAHDLYGVERDEFLKLFGDFSTNLHQHLTDQANRFINREKLKNDKITSNSRR
jgi:hypothetical protein